MVLENVCPPALLYLAFSIVQIIIDLFKGDNIQAFFKFIVMIIFTIVLNAICNAGMSIISWFIVFIPFILMTYITTILFFIFGVNPGGGKPKDCNNTQFGCCPDNVTTKTDPSGRNCWFMGKHSDRNYHRYPFDWPYDRKWWERKRNNDYKPIPLIGGCSGTRYGCCPDGVTTSNQTGSNCPSSSKPVGGCSTTQYGCCPDGVTASNKDATNCPSLSNLLPSSSQSSQSSQPQQVNSSTPLIQPVVGGCANTLFGCCPGTTLASTSDGSNCPVTSVLTKNVSNNASLYNSPAIPGNN